MGTHPNNPRLTKANIEEQTELDGTAATLVAILATNAKRREE